jgi:hypothetical protein
MKARSATLSLLLSGILTGCTISAFEEDTGPVPPDTHGLYWGTGVFVSDTVILTARHVVSECSEVRVASATGGLRGAHADILATGSVDMALIQIAQPAIPIAHARFRSLWPTDAQMATLTTKDASWLFDDEGPLIGYGYPTQSRSLTPLLEHLDGLAASRPETAHGYHPYVILGHIAHGDSEDQLSTRTVMLSA